MGHQPNQPAEQHEMTTQQITLGRGALVKGQPQSGGKVKHIRGWVIVGGMFDGN